MKDNRVLNTKSLGALNKDSNDTEFGSGIKAAGKSNGNAAGSPIPLAGADRYETYCTPTPAGKDGISSEINKLAGDKKLYA